ncbi:uncharacterized protein F4807DRAFT_79615 [Annulohypoxylon truncatum]|uniref:uncharacterized protein n=1 Tax=Annulohypoxylon truncatum TaxID=327061 RepID=UPI00200737C5|nr:uncharacterized protein F4807DRAFT_79615 [Annulohypoxylon truncatum]KAI1209952.1 hypothetical protein F4807DRAFT_79615 [Annulohypoxylon truncatum]
MRKVGSLPKLYIGSGTRRTKGVQARFRDYDLGNSLPFCIKASLGNGYKMTSRGLLAWMRPPPPVTTGSKSLRVEAITCQLSQQPPKEENRKSDSLAILQVIRLIRHTSHIGSSCSPSNDCCRRCVHPVVFCEPARYSGQFMDSPAPSPVLVSPCRRLGTPLFAYIAEGAATGPRRPIPRPAPRDVREDEAT